MSSALKILFDWGHICWPNSGPMAEQNWSLTTKPNCSNEGRRSDKWCHAWHIDPRWHKSFHHFSWDHSQNGMTQRRVPYRADPVIHIADRFALAPIATGTNEPNPFILARLIPIRPIKGRLSCVYPCTIRAKSSVPMQMLPNYSARQSDGSL